MKKLIAGLVLLTACGLSAGTTVRFVPKQKDAILPCGAKTSVAVYIENCTNKEMSVTVKTDHFGGDVISRKVYPFEANGKLLATVSETLNEPGVMRITVSGKDFSADWGVAFDPAGIRQNLEEPEDFMDFWKDARARAAKVPLDARVDFLPDLTAKRAANAKNWYRVSFATVGNRRVRGFLGVPKDASATKRYPVQMRCPGAGWGRHSNVPGDHKDAIDLVLTVFDFDPMLEDWEKGQSLYDNLLASCQKKYGTDCWQAGMGRSREESFYYPVILGIDRAVEWLKTRPYVKTDEMFYQGSSQGAGLGLALVAINGSFRRAVFFVPAITGHAQHLTHGRQDGWPYFWTSVPEKERDTAFKNARYFDGVNFARHITCPVRFVVGLADSTCSPNTGFSAYNVCASKDKQIKTMPGEGHSVPEEVYNFFDVWVATGK